MWVLSCVWMCGLCNVLCFVCVVLCDECQGSCNVFDVFGFMCF